jgi:hypothetical protein
LWSTSLSLVVAVAVRIKVAVVERVATDPTSAVKTLVEVLQQKPH